MFQKISLIALSVLFFTGCHTTGGYKACGGKKDCSKYSAKAFLQATKGNKANGWVRIEKVKGKRGVAKVTAKVSGLKANSKHGFHIHEFGDCSNNALNAGGHFDYDMSHYRGKKRSCKKAEYKKACKGKKDGAKACPKGKKAKLEQKDCCKKKEACCKDKKPCCKKMVKACPKGKKDCDKKDKKACNKKMAKKSQHGSTDGNVRHFGDLGNLVADANGKASYSTMVDVGYFKKLMGRSIVVHQNADDLKTQPSGNSGPRISCGVLGISLDKSVK